VCPVVSPFILPFSLDSAPARSRDPSAARSKRVHSHSLTRRGHQKHAARDERASHKGQKTSKRDRNAPLFEYSSRRDTDRPATPPLIYVPGTGQRYSDFRRIERQHRFRV
jgi:hypothetical protein